MVFEHLVYEVYRRCVPVQSNQVNQVRVDTERSFIGTYISAINRCFIVAQKYLLRYEQQE